MNLFEPALFGAIQGLTEFLPVSSSGHLLLLHSVTQFSIVDDLAFDVALHLGTLVALVAYFWRDLFRILAAWFRSFRRWDVSSDPDQRLGWLLVIASGPAVVAGLAFETVAETAFRSPILVAITLMVAGVLLWLADRLAAQQREMAGLGWGQALLIGCAQAIALVPGISRSGATMAVGRLLRLKRDAAARFSFLMSAPILAGAVAKKLFDLRQTTLTPTQQLEFVVGIVVAGVVGWLAIRMLLRYISHHSYSVFMWYRLLLGGTTLAIILISR